MSDFRHRAEPVVKRSRSIHKGHPFPLARTQAVEAVGVEKGGLPQLVETVLAAF